MKLGEFDYKISRQVSFTRKELNLLIRMARSHYDVTCQAAGMSVDDSAWRKNGFLTVMTLWSGPHLWTFDKFDITAKILEMRGLPPYAKDLKLTGRLAKQMNEACHSLNAEYARLTNNPK